MGNKDQTSKCGKLKKSKFTPAPWQLRLFEHKYTVHKKDAPKEIIARIGGMSACSIGTIENEANAYIILAAPILYKTLKGILKEIPGDDNKELRAKITLALRVARGPI